MSAKIAQHLPVFPLAPEAVHVIGAPAEFREALSQGIRKARKRIVLASLYIGTSETRLVTELAEALAANADLELHVLVDFFRGHRSDSGGSSTATMLDPLLGRFPGRRFNEVFGLQHIKAYVFDDDVIISGANLSSDYFTTRQDRYVLFKDCSDLASFFSSLVNVLADLSPLLKHASGSRKTATIPQARTILTEFWEHWLAKTSDARQIVLADIPPQSLARVRRPCTFAAPAIQLGVAGIRFDEAAMLTVFKELQSDAAPSVTIASGYLNIPDRYKRQLLESKADINIVCSSPEANGFFNSRGVSRYIPHAYSYLEFCFFRDLTTLNKRAPVRLAEYFRTGWTWHAKGVWLGPRKSDALPWFASVVGSSNLNQRSLERDVEAQVYIFSRDSALRNRFAQNLDQLQKHTRAVGLPELRQRRIPALVKICARMLRTMF
ncbi:CDP-diacylglycerol--glycerol-3-phosphate 3-phosphatidyltransferase [Polyrhizophydium stewartii]|uniref:CDP-diacylglycerol--glycerol-3-phosphate 3-phosphatidyltransferase n=1 Tax=Polyrhizophydium stewartii TaxID=2732419 RepID=A0ABR4MXG5_9FUNG